MITRQQIIKKVKWRDLTQLSRRELLIENNITIPWFLASMGLAYAGYYWLALPFSFFFFLTGLRQIHNGFHKALGTGQFLTWLSLYINSLLMCVSAHAVQFNHLRHHKYCLGEKDIEGRSARMTWYQAILYGPIHIYQIHRVALALGNRQYRKRVMAELGGIVLVVAVAVYFQINWLLYHITVMLLGEMLSAFFAVWTVHHHTDMHPEFARTQRSFWKNKISFSMLYHMEHHLFQRCPPSKCRSSPNGLMKPFLIYPGKRLFNHIYRSPANSPHPVG